MSLAEHYNIVLMRSSIRHLFRDGTRSSLGLHCAEKGCVNKVWGGSRGGSGGSVEPLKLEPLTSKKL